MLLNMRVKNLALIDELDINFNDGLNIMTGETGAGKSIIIGSLGIGLGGKFPKELLRDENKDGLVELIFSIDSDSVRNALAEIEIETEEDELIILRKLSGGRVVNRINDETVTVAKIKQVAEIMINLHAQHEQQTLLKPAKHLEILDSFSEDIRVKKDAVKEAFSNYEKVHNELEDMNLDESERLKRLDFVKFEIEEIENAKLVIGEDEDLEALYKKINSSKDIIEYAQEAYDITGYDRASSAGSSIGRALDAVRKINSFDENADGLLSMISDIDSLLNDFNRELNEYMRDMEFDPETFNETHERLNLINGLKAKYGRTIEDILSHLEELRAEVDELVGYEERKNNLTVEEKKLFDILKKESASLTKIRKENALKLCKLISDSLAELNFNQVQFEMVFEEAKNYSANGNDVAIFMISTNVGEKMRPLYDVASGGELSRVMLAIKSCLAGAEDTPTLVFDEVDVGISGITAQKVARMMSKIAKHHQVISITHLPQIAAMADYNYLIKKSVVGNKTVTDITGLDYDGAIREIARLLGGEDITDTVLKSAEEMKNLANKNKE